MTIADTDGRVRSAVPPPEASAPQLRRRCDPSTLGFATTAEVTPAETPAGQELAAQALQLAADLDGGGFNAIVTGAPGTGRRAAVLAWLSQRARREPAAPDLVYLPNLADRLRPRAIDLPAGRGELLATDVAALVADATRSLARAFESEAYRARHRELHEQLDRRRRDLLGHLEARANALGVALQLTPGGVAMAPIAAKRPLTPDEAAQMPAEARSRFEEAVEELREPSESAFAQLRELDRETAANHDALNREVALTAVGDLVERLQERWRAIPAVCAWLDDVREDVIAHLEVLGPQAEVPPEVAAIAGPRPQPADRYAVNVLVRSDPAGGAPVVCPQDTSFAGLFGRIEYETTWGAVTTDHRHLRGGAVHAARGGYLVLDARDVLSTPLVWTRLKEVLQSRTLRIENPGAQYTVFPGVAPQPEPVDAHLLVVLIATAELHALLEAADEDVARLFKVHVAFDDEMPRTPEGERAYAALVSRLAADGAGPHFDAGAVAALVEHGSRIAGHQERLTTRRRDLVEVAREAGHRARGAARELACAADVRAALDARHARSALAERRLREAFADGTIQVDVGGSVVGQVNGLAVRAGAMVAFGHPVRITATAAPGEGHVVDIEREAELSGPLHAKGVLILTGFLAGRYCADTPLALRASVVFEQSYGPVEGDSASAAELLALLSALADAPVRQGVAVTGAIDQHGRVQAIGGVDEKVEGFFALCRARGLTGDQGVIVPATNLRHAMLDADVLEAIEAGRFHVWPVDTVDQALEVLTGRAAGTRLRDGTWTPGSLNAAVQARLGRMSDAARRATGGTRRRRQAP
jgi:lon-related putative ATP-dependent protease